MTAAESAPSVFAAAATLELASGCVICTRLQASSTVLQIRTTGGHRTSTSNPAVRQVYMGMSHSRCARHWGVPRIARRDVRQPCFHVHCGTRGLQLVHGHRVRSGGRAALHALTGRGYTVGGRGPEARASAGQAPCILDELEAERGDAALGAVPPGARVSPSAEGRSQRQEEPPQLRPAAAAC